MALLDEVAGGRQAGRPAADDGNGFLPVARGRLWEAELAALALVVGNEALQIADGRAGSTLLAQHAAPLALVLLAGIPGR